MRSLTSPFDLLLKFTHFVNSFNILYKECKKKLNYKRLLYIKTLYNITLNTL